MIRLFDTADDRLLGEISEVQLDFLRAELEEEGASDQDYWIDGATLEYLEAQRADRDLIDLLRAAIAGKEGVEILWRDTDES